MVIMQNNQDQSYIAQDNLRLEIAILQEDIKSQDPGEAKFKIPTISLGYGSSVVIVCTLHLYIQKYLRTAIQRYN